MNIKEAIHKIVGGSDLTESEMEGAMRGILAGETTPSQTGAFLSALRIKGETVDEITGAARALKSKQLPLQINNHLVNLDRDDINIEEETILTTSENGAKGTSTFNVSSATIFVAAGGGVRVVRQGNWPKYGFIGAADVLQNLGVNLDISRSDVQRCIDEVGIGFLFAPMLHGIMRYVDEIRVEMGIRTIFNLIGPLANPAGAAAHVLGVYEPALTEKMARVLKKLGAREAFVVFGQDTYDEISICGPTTVSRLANGGVQSYQLDPREYGFKTSPVETLFGGSAQDNARIIKEILEGSPGPKRDMVVLNAAAAFVAAGLDGELKAGIQRANDVIDSGKAKAKLEALVKFTADCSYFTRN
ncbi:MAG: anthranilate phosphoribosyltransferase [Deltaproteobacteria bacterium]|jgi:anthranilate phosphoribosyltransferase|nr:anthranilate phosphoribosyltransferase [Deltaproteobacteria bacterium]